MILTVIGARPQFIKAAVVSKAFAESKIDEKIIHTGQHYDERMSQIFWSEMGIPKPFKNLQAGSGSHARQTGEMMVGIEDISIELKPDAIMVYGDTNSTIAAALVASKLHIPLVHIEAGLRSFNMKMPEEVNRIVTDRLSNFLFCSSAEGVTQLAKEGITENVFDVGDVMYDAQLIFTPLAKSTVQLTSILPFAPQPFVLATIHRPSNTDDPQNLASIVGAFESFNMPVLWPVHPRNKNMLANLHIPANLYTIDPLSYFEMQVAVESCARICTDSGGLQKEAYWAKKPCITLREETEWVETVHDNWNIITGPSLPNIQNAFAQTVNAQTWTPLYGDGRAAQKIASVIKNHISAHR